MPRPFNLRLAAYLVGMFVAGSGVLRLASAAFAVVDSQVTSAPGKTTAAPSNDASGPAPAPLSPSTEVGPTGPDAQSPASTQSEPQSPSQSVVRIDLPVTWQLTRAGSPRSRASAQTESFRETWTLELRPGRTYFLQSPRARVEVFATGDAPAAAETGGEAVIPKSVVLAERDFARLVGVRAEAQSGDGEIDPEVAVDLERPITLPLSRAGRASADVSLIWSDDEHYAVHIDVGSSVLF